VSDEWFGTLLLLQPEETNFHQRRPENFPEELPPVFERLLILQHWILELRVLPSSWSN